MTYKLNFTITTIFIAILTLISTATTTARESYPLNTNWRVFEAIDGSADKAHTIALPYCWDSNSQTPINRATFNFIRTIHAPQEWVDKRIFIKFYGVQSSAEVSVNGRYVGEHHGGSTAFVYELTNYLKLGDDNDILIKVNSLPLTDMLPTSIEHEVYGGIYRDIELIVTPQSAFSPNVYGADGLFITTSSIDKNTAEGTIQLHMISATEGEHDITASIADASGRVIFDKTVSKVKINGNSAIDIPFEVKNITPWSPQSPTLYTVTAKLSTSAARGRDDMSEFEDQITATTGFRTIGMAIDGSVAGCVRINDTPTLMRGMSYFHDNPEKGGVTTKALLQRDLDQLRDLGANALRSAVVPHDKALYELCDQEGVLVWVDTPLSHSGLFSDVAFYPTEGFKNNAMMQLNEIIHQNYNHPSIVMWGIFSLIKSNDMQSTSLIRQLNNRAKQIDASRPTVATSNQNGDINNIPDLIVWQQDLGWSRGMLSDIEVWQNQIHNNWSNFRSAVIYGAGGRPEHQVDRSELEYKRGRMSDDWLPEVRQSRLHEEYSSALVGDSLFWGVWINSLYNYRSPRTVHGFNTQGLITFDRETKKDAYYLYRALWNESNPTLHIVDKRNNLLIDSIVSIKVYASPIEKVNPKIIINGEKLEMRRIAPAQYIYENLIVTGHTPITVRYGNMADHVELIYGSPLRGRE